jgi:HEAT repeat protein
MMQLDRMLRSDDMQDVQSAMGELSSMPKDKAVGLLEQLALDTEYQLRCRAVDGMVRISPERAEALALRFLGDPDPDVRLTSIHALWNLHSRAAAPLISRLLATDPDELVRSWSAFTLGHLGDASVLPVLETAAQQDMGTDHEGRPIRETAIGSIKMIRSRLADQDNPTTR